MAERVAVHWTEPTGICGACNGSGEGQYDGSRCARCRGSGEAPQPVELDRVECACGWACTGTEWLGKDDGLCPRCGTDLESEIEASRPAESDEAPEPEPDGGE